MDAPRISPLPPEERDERTSEVLASLGGELNIFTTLARHPKLLKQWSRFGGTLLYGGELPVRDRELLILRTGWNCGAEYEWGQHAAIARQGGVPDDDIARVASGPDAEGWDAFDATLLRAADELHGDSRLSQSTWDALADRYDERQLIELCMVVGQYHLVAMTLNSLGVEPESDDFPPLPA